MIIHSGGLYAVYGHPYGWFGADNGYVGEAYQFGLAGRPAAPSGAQRRSPPPFGPGLDRHRRCCRSRAWPARRAPRPDLHGPRRRRRDVVPGARRRPGWGGALLGGLAVGLLLLFLLANRNHIHLGTQADFTGAGEAPTFEVGPGNEFVFGAGAALTPEGLDSFMWAALLRRPVRPIPRSLWPTKHADAARFLNIPEPRSPREGPAAHRFLQHHGLGRCDRLGSRRIFDLWIEFWWDTSSRSCHRLGFGLAYRKALSQGGFWLALYALMTALSIFFVMQDWS